MPVPIGPAPARMRISPAAMRPPRMAAIASASRVKTRAVPCLRYTPSGPTTAGSIAVAFTTLPCGARFPTGKTTVPVSPRSFALAGGSTTSSASTPSRLRSNSRKRVRLSLAAHASRFSPSVFPETVFTEQSSNPRSRKCSITSGTPPARNTRTVGCPIGPFGSASTSRGVARFTSCQSATTGLRRPAAWAMAGMCSSRFVDPPNAACTTIAFRIAASVRISRVFIPAASSAASARADCTARSSHTACPLGASAECGSESPSASATTCDVAAVPRN